jgi:muconate cycloisomerase
LRVVREAIGPDVWLSVDANGGYTVAQAVWVAARLEKLDVVLFEQPTRRGDHVGMAEVRRHCAIPIMADESVFTPQDALRVVRMGAADVIKIKIIKTGGFYGAMKIAAIAETAGVPLTVGHGLAPGIQTAAEAHFASTLSFFKLPGEMNGVCRIARDVVEGSLTVRQGLLMVPGGPGLGVRLDRRALELLAA